MSIPIRDRTSEAEWQRISDPHTGGWFVKVLHHTGDQGPTSEEGTFQYLAHPHHNPKYPDVSVHDMVHRKGPVGSKVAWVDKVINKSRNAWHAGRSAWGKWDGLLTVSLGVEICHTGNPAIAYTDAQYEAVALNVAFDCAMYHIQDCNVTSHRRVRNEWIRRHPVAARLLRSLGQLQLKDDPIAWDWPRMWRRIDEIRAQWPAEFGIPLWYDSTTGSRVMST